MRRLIMASAVLLAAFNAPAIAVDDTHKTNPEAATMANRPCVRIVTNKGDIIVELNKEKAPITVENFLKYVDKGYYDGTIFHRVIPNFMIQGGGYDSKLSEKPHDAGIKNEWQNGLKNNRGAIAMARTSDPDSASSQFFIDVVDNPFLDAPRGGAAYAVFGEVIDGMDVVDKIKSVPTKSSGPAFEALPTETVVMTSVKRLSPDEMKVVQATAEKRRAEVEKRRGEAHRATLDAAAKLLKDKDVDSTKAHVSDTGLWTIDIKIGEGDSVGKTDKADVNYTGWLTNGTQFDSGQYPVNLRGGVIQGWLEGLLGMKAGGKRYLIIPPELAYGAAGRPSIPPNAVLVFEVEVAKITKGQ